MYLSDSDILRLIKTGRMSLTPFNERQLTANGYDLRIVPLGKEGDEVAVQGKFTMKPDGFARVKSAETIGVPNGYIAFMFLRSRYSRNGLSGMFAVIDSGFKGRIYASLKNLSDSDVEINLDDGVIQLVIAKLVSAATHPYGSTGKSHFQGQK